MSRVGYGIALTATSGLCNSTLLALARVLQQQELPYYRLSCVGSAGVLLGMLWWLQAKGIAFPKGQLKWVILRGLFGVGQTPSFLAVRVGAPVGDVAALTSTNIAVAALLGRLLLGERFTAVQGLALVCSLGGAVLVCRPTFVFGSSDGEQVPVVGYLLALCSGFSRACVYLVVRKAPEVHSTWFTLVTILFTIICWVALAQAEIMFDYTLDMITATPAQAIGWVSILGVLFYGNAAALSEGSQYCPAGVTATVSTGSAMVTGYVMQAALFGTTPSPTTAAGAVLMCVGMGASAFAARSAPAPAPAASAAGADGDASSEGGVSELVSWAVGEFSSGLSTEPLRRRSTATPAPVVVGSVNVSVA